MSRGRGTGLNQECLCLGLLMFACRPLHPESARKNPLSSKLLAKSFIAKNPETTDHGPKSIGHGLTIAAVAAKVATPEVGTLPAKSGAMPENGISACFVGI